MRLITRIRGTIIRNLTAKVTPHLWPSGFVDTDTKGPFYIFCFAPVNGNDNRSMGKVFNEELTCVQGFFKHGIIDAWGGGCACTPFKAYCLEDLIAIEKWMNKNFDKEVKRSKIFRELDN